MRVTRRTGLLLLLATVILASSDAAGAGGRAGGDEELRAFARAKRPADVLRGRLATMFRIDDSRRIAAYEDRRGRKATLFVARSRTQICIVLVSANTTGVGAGGGCSPAGSFFGGRHVAATSGRLFAGVVRNDVVRVVLVGSRGIRHRVTVTADGGFIYDCRAYNGCAGLIACVEAYGPRGVFLSGQPWLPAGCRRR